MELKRLCSCRVARSGCQGVSSRFSLWLRLTARIQLGRQKRFFFLLLCFFNNPSLDWTVNLFFFNGLGPPPFFPRSDWSTSKVSGRSPRSVGEKRWEGSDNNGALCAPPRRTEHTHIVLSRPPPFLKQETMTPQGLPRLSVTHLAIRNFAFLLRSLTIQEGTRQKRQKG